VVTIHSLKQDIVEAGRRVYARGYVASNDGNISARYDDRRVVITPNGISKGFMTPEDIIVVDMEGRTIDGVRKPSSEVFMHLEIYKHRPDVNGVCHAHPPHATGYAVAGIPLDKCILPEVVVSLGGIPLVEYGTPGTEEFYNPVLKMIDRYDAFLLANHGALTVGKDVFNAYYKMETLEHFAYIAFVAQQLGHLTILTKEQVDKLTQLRSRFGIQTAAECVTCEDTTCDAAQLETQENAIDKEALVKEVTEAILQRLARN
jgi:L-fuculose-phosphate aldolase